MFIVRVWNLNKIDNKNKPKWCCLFWRIIRFFLDHLGGGGGVLKRTVLCDLKSGFSRWL